MRGKIAILQQTFLQIPAITGYQHMEQATQRGLFRDLKRLLAVPHDSLEETHKCYFHFNHREWPTNIPLLGFLIQECEFG